MRYEVCGGTMNAVLQWVRFTFATPALPDFLAICKYFNLAEGDVPSV